MSSHSASSSCLKFFDGEIDTMELPSLFTFPFNYDPHPIALLAAEKVQLHLQCQTDWEHDFGIDTVVEDQYAGKMFGVLVVETSSGALCYISGFSGKLADNHKQPHFVPPIYNLYQEDGFYKKEEKVIVGINKTIRAYECSDTYINCKKQLVECIKKSESEISRFKEERKREKAERAQKRVDSKQLMTDIEYATLEEYLINESLKSNYDFKQLKKDGKAAIESAQKAVDECEEYIQSLKRERKNRSIALQQLLFDQYQFLNKDGELRGVCDIFKNTPTQTPPSGAGECAAPKLLQYAFKNNLRPVALAEFWWGQSPRTEIRKHGFYYPACKGKCEPILGHMLKGMRMDPNPVERYFEKRIDVSIVYEDETLVVVNKPEGVLSVPGKDHDDSVYMQMKERYPDATGPLSVHRLDMATSGLLLIAKTKEAHKNLQQQFEKKTIKKRYIAVLQGVLLDASGTVDLPLVFDYDNRPRQKVSFDDGKKAITRWEVISRQGGLTRVYFYPITGRTHQLRVHAAHTLGLNTPIVGDRLYGNSADRLHLHAETIEFTHPLSGERMKITEPAPF